VDPNRGDFSELSGEHYPAKLSLNPTKTNGRRSPLSGKNEATTRVNSRASCLSRRAEQRNAYDNGDAQGVGYATGLRTMRLAAPAGSPPEC